MTLALLLLTLPGTVPPVSDVARGQLQGPVLVPRPLAPIRGYSPRSALSNVITGSIVTTLGTGFGALGALGLISAASETGTPRTVYTVLGWTSLGLGVVLGAVGIPLLVMGIVHLADPGLANLSLNEQGLLTVRF